MDTADMEWGRPDAQSGSPDAARQSLARAANRSSSVGLDFEKAGELLAINYGEKIVVESTTARA